MSLLLIDNYDSFTYNLAQYLGELGAGVDVFRNDALDLDQIEALAPQHIVISPGPGRPRDAGISLGVVRRFADRIPLLGVCLGQQVIAEAFGGVIVHAPQLMHGKTSMVHHEGESILSGVESPFEATRYHSLVVRAEDVPDCLQVTAWTEDGTIMGLRHREFEVHAVQFHPESILTPGGKTILERFLCLKKPSGKSAKAVI